MVEQYQRRSALAHLGLALRAKHSGGFSVTLSLAARRTILDLRGEGNDFADAIYRTTKLHLPKPNRVTSEGDHSLFWLGPNEYFLIAPEDQKENLKNDLSQSMHGFHHAIVDLSESRTIFNLTGNQARDVLMRGMSIDLHPREFAAGQCVQSSLGKVNILLHQISDEPSYDIYVWNSFADYTWRWLEKISAPFGCRIKV